MLGMATSRECAAVCSMQDFEKGKVYVLCHPQLLHIKHGTSCSGSRMRLMLVLHLFCYSNYALIKQYGNIVM